MNQHTRYISLREATREAKTGAHAFVDQRYVQGRTPSVVWVHGLRWLCALWFVLPSGAWSACYGLPDGNGTIR